MNIKQLKEYIEDLPDELPVIVDDSPVLSVGRCIGGELQQKIGNYLSIESDFAKNRASVRQIQRLERYLRIQQRAGLTRAQAKEKFMNKYVHPYFVRSPSIFELTTKQVFWYEERLPGLNKEG